MIWFLIFVASYIIGVIGWSIMVVIENDYIETFNDLQEKLCNSPGFIPVLNIVLLVGYIIIVAIVVIVAFIYKYCGIEKLWNKIKDKKLPFRE